MMTKRWIAIALAALCLAGCQTSVPEATQEAYERWDEARAKVLYGVAREHLSVGQLDQARRKAVAALALKEDYHLARTLLAKVYIEQGHYGAAIGQLKQVLDARPKAAGVYYLVGVAQEKAGLLAEALASYRRCQTIEAVVTAGMPVMTAQGLSAVTAATEVLVQMRQLRQAQLYVESYLPHGESSPGMYELAGRIAMMQEDYPRAARFYQQACDLDPKNRRYREALAACEFHSGHWAAALEALENLGESDGYTVPVWVHTMIGDCLMAVGRAYEARDAYFAASELRPADAGVWTNLAKAALAIDDTPRAILSSGHALKLDPGRLDASLLLGYALLKDAQHRRAVAVLTQAARSHPRSGTLRCLLGRAYEVEGDGAEAVRWYAAALRVEPENQLAKELLAKRPNRGKTKLE